MKLKEAEKKMVAARGWDEENGELPNKYKGADYTRRVSSRDLLYNIVPTVSNIVLCN